MFRKNRGKQHHQSAVGSSVDYHNDKLEKSHLLFVRVARLIIKLKFSCQPQGKILRFPI